MSADALAGVLRLSREMGPTVRACVEQAVLAYVQAHPELRTAELVAAARELPAGATPVPGHEAVEP